MNEPKTISIDTPLGKLTATIGGDPTILQSTPTLNDPTE